MLDCIWPKSPAVSCHCCHTLFSPICLTSPQLLEYIWPAMMDALGKEPETEIQSVTMDSISEIVELVRAACLGHVLLQ